MRKHHHYHHVGISISRLGEQDLPTAILLNFPMSGISHIRRLSHHAHPIESIWPAGHRSPGTGPVRGAPSGVGTLPIKAVTLPLRHKIYSSMEFNIAPLSARESFPRTRAQVRLPVARCSNSGRSTLLRRCGRFLASGFL